MKWNQLIGYTVSAGIHAALLLLVVPLVLAQKPLEPEPELVAIDLAMFQPPPEPEPIPEPTPEPQREPISEPEPAPDQQPEPIPEPPKAEPKRLEPPKPEPKKVEPPRPEPKKVEPPKPDKTVELLHQQAILIAKQKAEQERIKQEALKRWEAEQVRKQREAEHRAEQARQKVEHERIQAEARKKWEAEQVRKQREAEMAHQKIEKERIQAEARKKWEAEQMRKQREAEQARQKAEQERVQAEARKKWEAEQARKQREAEATVAKAHAEQARQQAEARKQWEAAQAAKVAQATNTSTASAAGESSVTESNPLISSPRYRTPPTQPPYPRRAQEDGYEGTTIVEAQLDATGNVSTVKVHQSSGHSILDSAALGAVRAWKFEPARKNGQAIKSRVRVPVHFKLT